jgi:ketosteroid isomerase-like protein
MGPPDALLAAAVEHTAGGDGSLDMARGHRRRFGRNPPMPDRTITVVERYWALMAGNDFHAVGDVLADDFVFEMPQSGERIRGRERHAAMNAQYPAHGPWRFTRRRLLVDGDAALTETDVTDGVVRARALSLFTVRDGRIASLVEYWPEPFAAAAWRAALVERGASLADA